MAIVNSEIMGKFFCGDAKRKLYGENSREEQVAVRYETLANRFKSAFGYSGEDFFSASGRIEICGNHTDHNCGKVLVAAIGVDTLAVCAKAGDGRIRIQSEGYPEMSVDTGKFSYRDAEKGTSLSLVKGVVQGFLNRGYRVGGFSAAITSSVFRGAGVSSSASFELLIAEILNVYYNGGSVPKMEKAQISQFAENEFFGKPCGLLDQAGISLGGLSYIDFKDPANPVTDTVSPDFSGYDIVITNTGGDHSDLTECYASIRKEMNEVAACFQKKVLREVEESEFWDRVFHLKDKVSGRAILRAIHYFEENKRIESCVSALKKNDLEGFFAAVNASGDSSYRLLQNCYVPGETKQPIPLALAVSRHILGRSGAVRIHGGGFAGTILAFVRCEDREKYLAAMSGLFGGDNVFVTTVRELGAVRV